MLKKFFSILLCVAFLLSCALSVSAEPEEVQEVHLPDVVITNEKEFLAFAESCRLDSYSKDLYVVLDADLDLSDADFAGVPIFFVISGFLVWLSLERSPLLAQLHTETVLADLSGAVGCRGAGDIDHPSVL